MSTLVVIGYNDMHGAEEVRQSLEDMEGDYLIDLENAVVAVRKPSGKVKLHQAISLVGSRAVYGAFLGAMVGLFLMSPVLGAAVGAGAASGALTDLGINERFMKDLGAMLKPDSSALFVLVRSATPDKVLERLKGTGGTVLNTSLSHIDEAKLQAAIDASNTPSEESAETLGRAA